MAKRTKQSAKTLNTSMSAHAKIMQAKRTRDRWITAFVGLLIPGGLAGVIWFFAGRENLEENYSIVGQGEPVIVQVHQLHCADCDILRANTKRALKQINVDRLHYRIAYLHKNEGIAFASKHGAARETTLILFDKFARKQSVYIGVQDVEALVDLFTDLL